MIAEINGFAKFCEQNPGNAGQGISEFLQKGVEPPEKPDGIG
jgi:hypothetical protein